MKRRRSVSSRFTSMFGASTVAIGSDSRDLSHSPMHQGHGDATDTERCIKLAASIALLIAHVNVAQFELMLWELVQISLRLTPQQQKVIETSPAFRCNIRDPIVDDCFVRVDGCGVRKPALHCTSRADLPPLGQSFRTLFPGAKTADKSQTALLRRMRDTGITSSFAGDTVGNRNNKSQNPLSTRNYSEKPKQSTTPSHRGRGAATKH